MLLFSIFKILSLVGSVLISVFTLNFDKTIEYFIPLFYFIGLNIALPITFFLILYVVSLFLGKKERNKLNPVLWWITHNVVSYVDLLSGMRVNIIGKEKLPKDKRFLLVGNHLSRFDPMITMDKLSGYEIAYISKAENFKIPIAGPFIRVCLFMAVDRDDPRQAIKTFNRASKLLIDGTVSVGVFPEGTRSKDGKLAPFKAGVFMTALKAKVPIVVTCAKNTNKVKNNFPFRRTKVDFEIIAVIPYETIAHYRCEQISDMAYEMIERSLNT